VVFAMSATALDDGLDVPSPIDLRDADDAAAWAESAEVTRPWRRELRGAIADVLRDRLPAPIRVLELGPGPGWLAEVVLATCAVESYTLFDFSQPFLDMSRARLGVRPGVHFVRGDFKRASWPGLLAPPFDAIISMQAVHELRHKRHVLALYHQAWSLLCPGGVLVVCDHAPPRSDPRSLALYSTEAEQHDVLARAGFGRITTHVAMHGQYVCSGARPRTASGSTPGYPVAELDPENEA
jgi:SAM-dependent methyltransferase